MESKKDSLFTRPVWVALFALSAAVAWGWAYPLIKLGFEEFGILPQMTAEKMLFAGVRFMIAGAIVLVIAAVTRRSFAMLRGAVSEYGRTVGFPTPMNDRVVEIVHKIERGELKPCFENLQYFN